MIILGHMLQKDPSKRPEVKEVSDLVYKVKWSMFSTTPVAVRLEIQTAQ